MFETKDSAALKISNISAAIFPDRNGQRAVPKRTLKGGSLIRGVVYTRCRTMALDSGRVPEISQLLKVMPNDLYRMKR